MSRKCPKKKKKNELILRILIDSIRVLKQNVKNQYTHWYKLYIVIIRINQKITMLLEDFFLNISTATT